MRIAFQNLIIKFISNIDNFSFLFLYIYFIFFSFLLKVTVRNTCKGSEILKTDRRRKLGCLQMLLKIFDFIICDK